VNGRRVSFACWPFGSDVVGARRRDVRPVDKAAGAYGLAKFHAIVEVGYSHGRDGREVVRGNGFPVVCWLYSSVLTFGSCRSGWERIGNHVDRVGGRVVGGAVWSMVSA